QPQRNRREREARELPRRRSDPRLPARAINQRIREEDEAGPANRRVPGRERLGARKGAGLGDDHDRETDPKTLALLYDSPPASAASSVVERCHRQVTRVENEQPLSAGVPTSFPKISTLCVLPNPPGIR